MKTAPGPYVVAGQLFYRLCDGSSVSCECIAEIYAEKIIKAWNHRVSECRDILQEERAQLGAHPDHWKIANALDRAINRLEALS